MEAGLDEARWLDMVWAKAIAQAGEETGLENWPEALLWSVNDEVLNQDWFPPTA